MIIAVLKNEEAASFKRAMRLEKTIFKNYLTLNNFPKCELLFESRRAVNFTRLKSFLI